MKRILGVFGAPHPHWVGDGLTVRSLFSDQSHGKQLSPFVMNSETEIAEALDDFNSGRFGGIARSQDENHARAQDVTKNSEVLDSLR